MLVYRIVHKKYSHSLFVSGMAGRWNSKGNKVLYCAESIALAFLENMIRRQGVGFNDDFKIMLIDVPSKTEITFITLDTLDTGWRDYNHYSKCQAQGDKWYSERKTLLLKVPSAVLTESFNYVINTEHPDYKKVSLVEVTKLVPDKRIEEILKKFSKK
ncbi:MAG: RES family NAD+ phosphorylase [Bacteroidota bacterium]|nr:RES family NAD+ phosphorylase [Bacteroidota bacterium]